MMHGKPRWTPSIDHTTPHPYPDRPPHKHQAPDLAAVGAWETLATDARLALAFLLQSEEDHHHQQQQQQQQQQPPLPPPALRSVEALAAALGFARRLWACEGDPWAGRRMEDGTGETPAVPLPAPSARVGAVGAAASVYEACLQVRGLSGAPPRFIRIRTHGERERDLIAPFSFIIHPHTHTGHPRLPAPPRRPPRPPSNSHCRFEPHGHGSHGGRGVRGLARYGRARPGGLSAAHGALEGKDVCGVMYLCVSTFLNPPVTPSLTSHTPPQPHYQSRR